MTKKLTTEEFIEKAKKIHGDKFDYSLVNYINTHTNVTIICKIHGKFEQKPSYHLDKCGCKLCINRKQNLFSTEDFIDKSRATHGDLYDYSKSIFTGSKNNIKIICKVHGEIEQIAYNHMNGAHCTKCSKSGRKFLTKEILIKRSIETHGNKFDYSKADITSDNNAIIICKNHSPPLEFKQNFIAHSRGAGCSVCSKKNKVTKEEFLSRAKIKHGDRFDYSLIEYINQHTDLTIVCKVHGEFKQTASSHLSHDICCPSCLGYEKLTAYDFIKKANKLFNNRFDYDLAPSENFINKLDIITITCKQHGQFQSTINSHLKSIHGCLKCSKIKTNDFRAKNKAKFIERSKTIHGDAYDYSKVNYTLGDNKVIIICNKHGEFLQKPKDHVNGNGCYKCGLDKIKNKNNAVKITKEIFLKRSEKTHTIKYDYSQTIMDGVDNKITIICYDHGKFTQSARLHMSGANCPLCANKINAQNMALSHDQFVEKAMAVHGNVYNYSFDSYINSGQKINILCNIHGIFSQTPNAHLVGQGCPECGKIKLAQIFKEKVLTNEEFIEVSKNAHGDKYDYKNCVYKGCFEKVNIICEKHGSFWQTAISHSRGSGCRKCGKENTAKLLSLTREEFIKRAQTIHGDKYDYSSVVYKNHDEKVEIICKKHGPFWQKANGHLSKKGCKKCTKIVSFVETKWLDSLNLPNDREHRSVTKKINDKVFKLDGFDPKTNTVYEFYGDYWHGNPNRYNPEDMCSATKTTFAELYEKTMEKEKLLKEAGYNLVTIWESDFNKMFNQNKKFVRINLLNGG